ncbi:MAG TPA: phage tail protein [Candidatus Mucispirillum faecigallinarum]|uniref:Phage tail protein n=1 Tax=Candidatus Mucispirillum faecigallinarum TaxID=2838699 RepID=A0A9D2GUC6_9BACT|nr:phage tail protein [Candidatus Mucispirillum faecigallinarum]
MLGSYGKITFKVTEEEIKIFDNFNITRKARYVAHERINNKPLLQFMGLDADSISFNMQLVQGITGNVSDDLKSLQDMFKKAEVHPLFLGQKKLGSFVIESINEAYKIVDNLGNLEVVNVSLSLKEYVG